MSHTEMAAPVEFGPTDRLCRAAQVVSTCHDGETVIFDLVTNRYHMLNDVGTRVWELLDTETTLEAIVAALSREYILPPDADSQTLIRDASALIRQLWAFGALSTVRAAN